MVSIIENNYFSVILPNLSEWRNRNPLNREKMYSRVLEKSDSMTSPDHFYQIFDVLRSKTHGVESIAHPFSFSGLLTTDPVQYLYYAPDRICPNIVLFWEWTVPDFSSPPECSPSYQRSKYISCGWSEVMGAIRVILISSSTNNVIGFLRCLKWNLVLRTWSELFR